MATTRSRLWLFSLLLLSFSLFFRPAPATAAEDANEHFNKGKSAFDNKNYEEALAEMQRVVELLPKEPLGYSGKAACLNALKRYPEAKKTLEEAFRLLQAQRTTLYTAFNPIDINYYALLADVQTNLHEFAEAVQTINKYAQQKMKGEDRPAAEKAAEGPKNALRTKMVAVGLECLGSGDLACARNAFTQADVLSPASADTLLRIAKESLNQAETGPAATDEDKARKTELYRMAIEFCNRLPEAERGSPDVQRMIARALSGTKDAQDYQKAITILTSISDSSALLDLAAVYSNHEEWDQALNAVTKYLQNSPKDARAGFCRRSFVQFKLKNCQQAIEDGAKCTNPDGTPRQLAYVDWCRAELAKQQTVDTAGREEALRKECTHLRELVDYAMYPDAPMVETVDIIRMLEASKGKCKAYLGTTDTSAICKARIDTAKNPLNLSLMTQAELQALYEKTGLFLKLCSSSLDEGQKAALADTVKMLGSKLSP